jgi:hypothetical protein
MTRFDGTAARQLDLIDYRQPAKTTKVDRTPVDGGARRPNFRLLKQDVYAEILRRRRRAQIAARHLAERAEQG